MYYRTSFLLGRIANSCLVVRFLRPVEIFVLFKLDLIFRNRKMLQGLRAGGFRTWSMLPLNKSRCTRQGQLRVVKQTRFINFLLKHDCKIGNWARPVCMRERVQVDQCQAVSFWVFQLRYSGNTSDIFWSDPESFPFPIRSITLQVKIL